MKTLNNLLVPWRNRNVSAKCVDKFNVLSWCEQTEILPVVSLILVMVLLTDVPVELSCTVLSILVVSLLLK